MQSCLHIFCFCVWQISAINSFCVLFFAIYNSPCFIFSSCCNIQLVLFIFCFIISRYHFLTPPLFKLWLSLRASGFLLLFILSFLSFL
nr:MAG TPA: hypothetical protein [Caudoviricetes sp.]